MVKIDTQPIRYLSQLDEASFFEWALKIPCVTSVDNGYLHIRSTRLSESNLRELIALMHRYKLPMKPLRQFLNANNAAWFKSEDRYWYKSVFAGE